MPPEMEPLLLARQEVELREETLEEVPCPLCGTEAPPAGGYAFPPHRVVRCPGCGLWYLTPRLTEAEMLRAYEEEEYFEGGDGPGYSSYLAQESTLRSTFRRFLARMAERGMTGGRLLEVGCAYGFFLDEARSFFSHRAGTDFSAAAAGKARQLADAVYLGGLDAVPEGEVFDCAVLIHVIEHIYDPVGLIRRLLTRLRPGGQVVLAAPDMGGFWRHLQGKKWPFFKMPEHVSYFSRPTLAALLRRAGCEAVAPLPYASFFTGDLIAEKLGRPLPAWLARRRFRLPATTVAAAGRKPTG